MQGSRGTRRRTANLFITKEMSKHDSQCLPFLLNAKYNLWFNKRLSQVAKGLEDSELLQQINHLHVMDCLWLWRFGIRTPSIVPPESMDECRFDTVAKWYKKQKLTDNALFQFVEHISNKDLSRPIRLVTMAEGELICRPLWSLLVHLFNHQSLHRGEILLLLRGGGTPSDKVISFHLRHRVRQSAAKSVQVNDD